MSASSIRDGHEDADEDVHDTFRGPMLEQGAPPANASLDAAQKRKRMN